MGWSWMLVEGALSAYGDFRLVGLRPIVNVIADSPSPAAGAIAVLQIPLQAERLRARSAKQAYLKRVRLFSEEARKANVLLTHISSIASAVERGDFGHA